MAPGLSLAAHQILYPHSLKPYHWHWSIVFYYSSMKNFSFSSVIPYQCNFWIIISWLTVSKAFFRSRKMTAFALPCLISSGKIFTEMKQVKISVNEDDITCAEIFSILLGIMSVPLVLPLGKLASKLYTCLGVICFSLKDVWVLLIAWTGGIAEVCVSCESFSPIDEKYWFNLLEISCFSEVSSLLH